VRCRDSANVAVAVGFLDSVQFGEHVFEAALEFAFARVLAGGDHVSQRGEIMPGGMAVEALAFPGWDKAACASANRPHAETELAGGRGSSRSKYSRLAAAAVAKGPSKMRTSVNGTSLREYQQANPLVRGGNIAACAGIEAKGGQQYRAPTAQKHGQSYDSLDEFVQRPTWGKGLDVL